MKFDDDTRQAIRYALLTALAILIAVFCLLWVFIGLWYICDCWQPICTRISLVSLVLLAPSLLIGAGTLWINTIKTNDETPYGKVESEK